MLPEKRSGQLSSIFWKARKTVVSWANRPVGVLSGVPSCPAWLRPAAPPCAVPRRPTHGMSGFWTRQVVPGHALHEKGFTKTNKRRSIGQQPGTKSGRRPADKPRINRGSTARCVPPSVYIGFRLFVLPRIVQDICLRCPGNLGGQRSGCLLGRPTHRHPISCPAPLRPAAPPCAAPPRPARGMSGFGLDKLRWVYTRLVVGRGQTNNCFVPPRIHSRARREQGTIRQAADRELERTCIRWDREKANDAIGD